MRAAGEMVAVTGETAVGPGAARIADASYADNPLGTRGRSEGSAGLGEAVAGAASDPFDDLATDYDASFTGNPVGKRMRAAVERRLAARFTAGDRVLDLGCGTGEDAVRLARRGVRVVAVDASAAMVAAARAKVVAAGVGERVTVHRADLDEVALALAPAGNGSPEAAAARLGPERSAAAGGPSTCARQHEGSAGAGGPAAAGSARGHGKERPAGRRAATDTDLFGEPFGAAVRERGGPAGAFDGAYSDFGALNCVADLDGVAAALARLVRPGGAVVLCVMGPLAPWEWLLGFARLRPSLAVRRLRPGGARWRGRTVRYPSPRRLRRAFAPWFAAERLAAVGALLPPPSLAGWAARHAGLVDRLDRWERRAETLRPLPWLADHYVLELVRR